MSKNINPMLLCDFYKTVHSDMINPKMTKSNALEKIYLLKSERRTLLAR